MQIAQRIQQVLSQKPGEITLASQQVIFERKIVQKTSKKTVTDWAKARWKSFVGLTKRDKHGNHRN